MILWSMLFATALSASAEVTMVSARQIHTMSREDPQAEALVFDGAGTVLAVGNRHDLRERFPAANSIEYPDATIVPGLIDAHGHLLHLGLSLLRVDLVGATSRAEVLARLRVFDDSLPEGIWLLGRGWDQNDWPDTAFPTRTDLDADFPNRPIWLMRIDGHAGWANSAALAATDRDLSGDWQPAGGRIVRDREGRATGVFVDRAMALVASAVPEPGPEVLREAIARALAKVASVGLTGVHDAGVSNDQFELYRDILGSGPPTLRIYAMADGAGALMDHLCKNGPLESDFLTARAVKVYADGALGSRGAALHSDYSDDPGNRGLLVQSPSELARVFDRAMGCGLQVNTHAIGDRGNTIALDLYARFIQRHPANPGRHRIEHAQVVRVEDIKRFGALQVIASVQPTHATSDMYWAEERLGPARLGGAYAWASLVAAGARLALGSDFPVERPDPLLGIYAAVTRQDLQGWPNGGWRPKEALTREQALAGFTRDAAYAAFAEDRVGSLEAGKRADFVVLSGDLMTVPAPELPALEVIATFVDGRRVYGRPP